MRIINLVRGGGVVAVVVSSGMTFGGGIDDGERE